MAWRKEVYFNNILTSLFAGFKPSSSRTLTSVYIAIYACLILIFIVPVFFEITISTISIYSFFIALAILLEKIYLYLRYMLYNKNDKFTQARQMQSINQNPLLSNKLSSDQNINYYMMYNNNDNRRSDSQIIIDPYELLEIVQPPSKLNVAFSVLCAFTSNFFLLHLFPHVKFVRKIFLSLVNSCSIYSILQPPSVELYSTTIDDKDNAFTRSFFITLIGFVAYIINSIKKPFTIPLIDYYVDIPKYQQLASDIATYLIISTPFLILFGFVGHPKATFLWLLEWINMYGFGQNGISGPLSGIVNFLRGCISILVSSLILRKKTDLIMLAFCLSAIIFVVQFPFPFEKRHLRNHIIYMIATSVLVPFVVYSIIWLSMLKHRTVMLLVIIPSSILDLVLPHIFSNQKYFFLHFRVKNPPKCIGTLRLITPLLIAPLYAVYMVNSLSPRNVPCWVSAFFMTQVISLAMSEPHIFAVATIISYGTIEDELGYAQNRLVAAFLGLWIARKLFSVYGYFEFYSMTRRIPGFDLCENIKSALLLRFLNRLPFIDTIIKLPVILWSSFFGTPPTTPFMFLYLILPSPPKPTVYWDSNEANKISPELALSSQISEHPIEAPVYASVAKSLTLSLRKMIKNGQLGRVTAGDFFLFESEDKAAFVQIIENSALSTKFQIRGLEFSSQTWCHRKEKMALTTSIYSYDKFPNVYEAIRSSISTYEIRSMGLYMTLYDAAFLGIQAAFFGCPIDQIKRLIYLTLCYQVSRRRKSVLSHVVIDDIDFTAPDFRRFSGLLKSIDSRNKTDELREKRVYALYEVIISAFITPVINEINPMNIYLFFNHKFPFTNKFAWLNRTTKAIKRLLYDSFRLSVLAITHVAASLIDDFETDINEVAPTLSDLEKEIICARIEDERFNVEFEKAQKPLFSIIFRKGVPVILKFSLIDTQWTVFRMKNEFIRAFWTNESRSSVFFGENNSERQNIQAHPLMLNNMILQTSDLPTGYPGFVSPILSSYDFQAKRKEVNLDQAMSIYV